jgi:hypothetical protein
VGYGDRWVLVAVKFHVTKKKKERDLLLKEKNYMGFIEFPSIFVFLFLLSLPQQIALNNHYVTGTGMGKINLKLISNWWRQTSQTYKKNCHRE